MTQTAAAPASVITPEIVAEHGLSPEEYERVLAALGREPNLVELGIFSVMWSEHCSYKSSRLHLKKLPTEAPWVICGPGENAGVIDIGEGPDGKKLAAIFKMESHNHPSYIEPYQGAATGVGGILRDVFTMGARPVANLNALRFGRPDHPKMKHLISGVVHGIGGYGNCVGVPTVGGEVNFHKAYDGNILVNAMTVGVAEQDKIFYSAASGVGNPIVYVGSKTGRDGIHGATMGAAGLTSSSVEMASKGGVGLHLKMDDVPQRETGMTAYEMMLSESQERMLLVLKPGKEEFAKAIFHKWELDFAVIGTVTDTGRMVLEHHGEIVCDIPLAPLADDAPLYDRPHVPTPKQAELTNVPETKDVAADLKTLMGTPDIASRRWIWEQYDSQVGGDTVQIGGDAALVRIHGTNRALAMSTDCTPRYCYADPVEGGKQAVAETWRNISAVGATPLAITNCLNFANPQRPEIMGQIVGCLDGMAQACRALDYPIVSGNVSLYNESKATGGGSAILPTPAIGGVGVIEDLNRAVGIGFKRTGDIVLAVGERAGHLGQSVWLREILGREEGPPPPVDLKAEKRTGDFIRQAINAGWITACHDVSDGGLAVTLAEMALKSNIGVLVSEEQPFGVAESFFGEDQGLYLVTVCDTCLADLLDAAGRADVPVDPVGRTIKDRIVFELEGSDHQVTLAELREAHEGFFPNLMGADAALA
jgi:phosphoribosylformylglycinamidine synthase